MVILAIPGKERKKSIFETSPYLLVLLPKYANICDIAAFFALGARLKTETELQKQSNRILISDKSIETELGKRQKELIAMVFQWAMRGKRRPWGSIHDFSCCTIIKAHFVPLFFCCFFYYKHSTFCSLLPCLPWSFGPKSFITKTGGSYQLRKVIEMLVELNAWHLECLTHRGIP